jgi:hypothetical protein
LQVATTTLLLDACFHLSGSEIVFAAAFADRIEIFDATSKILFF